MKEVIIYVKPEKLELVKTIVVDKYGCGGMTVLNAMGCGNQKGFQKEFQGYRTNINLLPKLKIEVVLTDDKLEPLIQELCERLPDGGVGDGKIVVKDVADVIRIRTGEHGESAV